MTYIEVMTVQVLSLTLTQINLSLIRDQLSNPDYINVTAILCSLTNDYSDTPIKKSVQKCKNSII